MKMPNKVAVVQIVIIAAFFLLVSRVSGGLAEKAAATDKYYAERVVVIDAGHGDFDPGKVAGDGTLEKDINLSIALKLYDIFKANGYTAVLTRSDDTTLADKGETSVSGRKKTDTRNRTSYTDSFLDSVLISIHQNSYGGASVHGTQLFYGTENPESEILAESIMASIVKNVQPDNTRPLKRGTDSIYILVHTKAPTVLVECGFMTNQSELANLKDEEYQKKLAYSIYYGYLDYCAYLSAGKE